MYIYPYVRTRLYLLEATSELKNDTEQAALQSLHPVKGEDYSPKLHGF